ncbi:MAG: hypothetical protein U0946_03185, partial [Patescibacteria group bacterium]|nr:hypothetical protein [Patescibacteria group bacterium]
MADENKQPPPQKPKKSKKWWCCGVAIFIIALIGVAIYWYESKEASSNVVKFSPPRNYQYHEPSTEALNRNLDCKKLVLYARSPEKQKYNILCLNLYQTSPEDIAAKIAAQKYDRIIIYGEKAIFDANPSITAAADFSKNFYYTAKFTDQYTLPKMMTFYGLSDLSYITKDFSPYPALLYELEPISEVHRICKHNSASGCAQMHIWSILDEKVLTEHIWTNREFLS